MKVASLVYIQLCYFHLGLDAPLKQCEIFTLENTNLVQTIFYLQLLCHQVGECPPAHSQVHKEKVFSPGLHRVLTSVPSKAFRKNSNNNLQSGLITPHQCCLMLLWLNESKKSGGKPSTERGGCYSSRSFSSFTYGRNVYVGNVIYLAVYHLQPNKVWKL